jgi:glycerophosphoryl diester phosphodiesterase
MTNVIAHRGASRAANENTIEAFELAVAMGVDGIELDVRWSRDGCLVVHHDARIWDARIWDARIGDARIGDARIWDARIEDGAAIIDLDRRDLPGHIPDLHDALVACAGSGSSEVTVNIEIKNDAGEPDFDGTRSIAPHVVREALAVGDPERWLISSFDLAMADAVLATGAGIATAWLVVDVPVGAVSLLGSRGHSALHPWVGKLSRSTVDECHASGLAVNTWTCDDPERMRELIGWGIDGICTNVPDIALAVRDAI